MATKYIKRKDVIEAICNLCKIENDDCSYPRCTIINEVKNIPAADVVERKHGKWIYQFHEDEVGVTCSECEGYAESFARWIYDEGYRIDYNYCPNCGAEMESTDDV